MSDKVPIRRLLTGVPGLDAVLGGGVPEFSFNVIAGMPGTGKTTLAQQIMFALAGADRPAIFFTVLGEPPLKMLRYQQQFEFFDLAKINASVRFINLTKQAREGGLDAVLAHIAQEVEATSPAIVIVDSFRSVMQAAQRQARGLDVPLLVQELGIRLTGWQATAFLVGEFQLTEFENHPIFAIADGLIWLHQSIDRDSMVRKMQVMKMRGQAPLPGLHAFRVTQVGIEVFPRLIADPPEPPPADGAGKRTNRRRPRLSTGVPGLDEMLGGGVPSGYSVLIAGPSGSGKSILAAEFIREGSRRSEPGVIAVFEKRPTEYRETNAIDLDQAARHGHVAILRTRPLDLSIDETVHELMQTIHRIKAKRVVIDSLSGFELTLAPMFRENFRESLYRLIGSLTGMGLTVMMTAELEDSYTELRFGPQRTAFLADAIILQRYVELEGELKRMMTVVKVRACAHKKDLRLFEVTDDGIVVGDRLGSYQGLLTGSPHVVSSGSRLPHGRPMTRRPKS